MTDWINKGCQQIESGISSNEYISDKNAHRAFQMGKRIVGDVATLANLAQGWEADPDRQVGQSLTTFQIHLLINFTLPGEKYSLTLLIFPQISFIYVAILVINKSDDCLKPSIQKTLSC